jgi:putative copper resistance protein D
MTLGWSGHAAATEGALGWVHRLGNGVHLLAAGLWIGAIGGFGHLTMIAHRKPGRVPVVPLLAAMHAFAPFGVALVATVSITGPGSKVLQPLLLYTKTTSSSITNSGNTCWDRH